MALDNFAYVFAGRDHEELDRAQGGVFEFDALVGRLAKCVIDAVHAFDIGIQAVHEQGIEHVTGDLSDRRVGDLGIGGGCSVRCRVAYPDNQQPVGTQVQRRAQGGAFAHGAVTVVFIVQPDSREYQRDGRGRHEVIDTDLFSSPEAARSLPGLQAVDALEVADGMSAAVAGGGDSQGTQCTCVNSVLYTCQADVTFDKCPLRAVVEQCAWRRCAQVCSGKGGGPVQAAFQCSPGICVKDLVAAEIFPDTGQV